MASGSQRRSKQTTLLQTWGYAGNESVLSNDDTTTFHDNNDNDDDDMLNKALEASMAQYNKEPRPPQPSTSRAQVNSTSIIRPPPPRNSFPPQTSRNSFPPNRQNVSSSSTTTKNISPHVSPSTSGRLSTTSLPDPSNFEELPEVPEATPLEDLPGFDVESGRTWIYPTNYPVRKYQFDIVKSCLFQNTLVTLPTGLGKTFIAAVVMYNFYRWYPQGRVVFMAPTKPLVAQQIEACFKIMGVPQIDMSEMTGNVAIAIREQAWKQKRIFFLTPQVMSNDLSRGLFPANQVKLLVVDEAHRAQGDYAYCQVIKEMERSNAMYRVVALSATPGSDINAVKLVLQNLKISNIELRNEESPDIVPYTFQRNVDKVVVPLGAELNKIKMEYISVMEPFVKRLAKMGLLPKRGDSIDPTHYSKFGLLQARNEFRQNPPARMDMGQRGTAEGDFASAISLYHAFDLLLQHGMRTFYNFVAKTTGEDVNTTAINAGNNSPAVAINRRLRYDLTRNPTWQNLMSNLKQKFSEDLNNSRLNSGGAKLWTQFSSTAGTQSDPLVLGHPKLEKLRDMVLQHFRDKENEKIATRVMIFSQYRDSVQEITACLHAFKPLIKVMEFVGQAGTKGKRGLTQKEQIEVVRRFRDGGYNTLVATCVGEEGLDIGEVDLIVCYDVSKSPIRLVQRMGRTGRKRAGRIIVLVTEGKEERTYNQSMYSRNSINKAILEKNKLTAFLCPSPRMIPLGMEPVCHKMVMAVVNFIASKSGRSAIAAGNNRRISGMLEDQRKSKGSVFREANGYLSPTELQYWNDHFCMGDGTTSTLPTLKPPRETWCLSKEDIIEQIISPTDPTTRHFDLSEWLLWQSEVQERHFVSQSATAKLFQDINGFITTHKYQKRMATQNGMNEDDDFGYSAEMAAWLNAEDDEPKPSTGIDRFFNRGQSPILQTSVCAIETRVSTDAIEVCDDDDDHDIVQMSFHEVEVVKKELTEREKIILELLGPCQTSCIEIPSPPDFKNVVLPNKDEILSFDVVTFWTHLVSSEIQIPETSNESPRKDVPVPEIQEPSGSPLSPVIYSSFDKTDDNFTSTPLPPFGSKRQPTLIGETSRPKEPDNTSPISVRSFNAQSQLQSDLSSAFLEAAALAMSFEAKMDDHIQVQTEAKKIEQNLNNSYEASITKNKLNFDENNKEQQEEFWKAKDNFSFGKETLLAIQNLTDKSNDTAMQSNASLFSATQLVSLLDKSQAPPSVKNVTTTPNCNTSPEATSPTSPELKTQLRGSPSKSVDNNSVSTKGDSDTTNEMLYSLDCLPPLQVNKSDQDMFSEFDLGSSPEMPVDDDPVEPRKPVDPAEFKVPNLEDFELRSKTPKKVKAKKPVEEELLQSPANDEASESIIGFKRKTKGVAFVLSSSDEDESDQKTQSPKNESQKVVKLKRKKSKFDPARRFLDTQAQLSEDEDGQASSDESHHYEDDFDASFVDDGTQQVSLDQRAMYLQSIKSPPLHFNRRTLPSMRQEDIFSQMPNDSELLDEFEHDSFVVDNSVVEFESSLDELDFVEEFESEEERRRKKKRKKAEKSSDEQNEEMSSPPRKKTRMKKRQRIMIADSSSSEREEEIVILSQNKVVKTPPLKSDKPKPLEIPQVETNRGPNCNLRNSKTENLESGKLLPPTSVSEPKEMFQSQSDRNATSNCVNLSNEESPAETLKTVSNSTIGSLSLSYLPGVSNHQLDTSVASNSLNNSTFVSNSESFSVANDTSTRRTLIVSAADVHRSNDLISELKHKYNCDVVVRNGLNVGFILSPRLGIHRMSSKDFCNGSNRVSLVEHCQKMNDMFEKPFLLVETVKPDNPDVKLSFSGGFVEQHGGIHRTKYIDTVLAQLSQSKIQVLFSGSQIESALIISALSAREARKGFVLPYPLRLSDTAERVLPFYQSLPGVSFGTALMLVSKFKSVRECAAAPQATLVRKVGLDEKKAKTIREFFRKKFSGDISADAGN